MWSALGSVCAASVSDTVASDKNMTDISVIRTTPPASPPNTLAAASSSAQTQPELDNLLTFQLPLELPYQRQPEDLPQALHGTSNNLTTSSLASSLDSSGN